MIPLDNALFKAGRHSCNPTVNTSLQYLIFFFTSAHPEILTFFVYKCLFLELTREGNGNPTSVFLTGKVHGQRILAGYSPWSRIELATTEQLST